ncbi:MAG: CDP-glycerol glycerophosphotransferase family protein [Anaerolineales bacterium]|nr:CDP-glycerol glycerophosphotransferase family protein [Anaerolineales bacterium]
MPTILLAIPFGQTVRDVLYSDTWRTLRRTPDLQLVIATQAADDARFVQAFAAPNVHIEPLHPYIPNRFERTLRSFHLATLRQKSSTIAMYSQDPNYDGGLRRLSPLADAAQSLLGDTKLNQWLGWASLNLAPTCQYADLFDKYQPDLVVVTRVLGSSPDFPVLKQAAQRQIPVLALVSSWDNFTSKGFFPFGVNWLVVWNELMRDEAVEMFDFPADRIFLSGIPRFDAYFRGRGFRSRETFFAELGLDPNKPLITFATATRHLLVSPHDATSPEPEIVAYLAEAIAANAFGREAQLLVRLHPLADLAAYAPLAAHPCVTLQVPGQQQGAFADRTFSRADDRELAETMCYSDVVVNIASTTTIDAAVFDTPVVGIGFDMRGERPFLHSPRRFYAYEHYRKLGETGGFRVAWAREDLINHIRAYLDQPSLDRNGRLRIVRQQCHNTDGRAGERVGQHILNILQQVCTEKWDWREPETPNLQSPIPNLQQP